MSKLLRDSLPVLVKIDKSLIYIFVVAGILPPMVFLVIDLYYGNEINWQHFALRIITSVVTTLTISWAVVSIILRLQIRHPWRNGIVKRLLLEISLTTLTACLLLTVLTFVFLPIFPVADLRSALFNWLIVAVIMNAILVTITEGIFFFRQWRSSAMEAERFEKEKIRAQFENLKSQISPHFLFNSLNILTSLIDEDKEMSKEFVHNLSQVYRYILQYKDEELVDLQTEINFVHAYCALLKTRYVNSISFHFNLSDASLRRAIPPMVLQILIENAVKHNIMSQKKPLTVEVFALEEKLVVRNNLQTKTSIASTGTGLKNIEERYRYLSAANLRIDRTTDYFEVQLPLLKYPQKSLP